MPNRAVINDIFAQLKILQKELTAAKGEGRRRSLLRQFRELLDEADQIGLGATEGDLTPPSE